MRNSEWDVSASRPGPFPSGSHVEQWLQRIMLMQYWYNCVTFCSGSNSANAYSSELFLLAPSHRLQCGNCRIPSAQLHAKWKAKDGQSMTPDRPFPPWRKGPDRKKQQEKGSQFLHMNMQTICGWLPRMDKGGSSYRYRVMFQYLKWPQKIIRNERLKSG